MPVESACSVWILCPVCGRNHPLHCIVLPTNFVFPYTRVCDLYVSVLIAYIFLFVIVTLRILYHVCLLTFQNTVASV